MFSKKEICCFVVSPHSGLCHRRVLHVGQSGMKEECCNPLKSSLGIFTNAHMATAEHVCKSQPRAGNMVITVLRETVGAMIHCCLRAGSGQQGLCYVLTPFHCY